MNIHDIPPRNRQLCTPEQFARLSPESQEWLRTLDFDTFLHHREIELGGIRWRLNSESSGTRVYGISKTDIARPHDLVPDLKRMLEDDAPYADTGGTRPMIYEVRVTALCRLQQLYRHSKDKPDFGLVKVRKRMPAHVAEAQAAAALTRLDDRQRNELFERVELFLETRVQPQKSEREMLRCYRILQELGLIEYRTEEVDPITYLTPMQEEERIRQTEQPRPLPHLRIASARTPMRTLGFLYRDPLKSEWSVDFSDCDEAREAQSCLQSSLKDLQGRPDTLLSIQARVDTQYCTQLKQSTQP